MDAFQQLAARRNLLLIEDGACSLGATYKGKRVGGIGAPTCFSFHPRKMITTGEGGMITTSDATLAEKARVLRATGASISDLERHKAKGVLIQKYEDIGYNYRMTDIQAAIGLVQMRKSAPCSSSAPGRPGVTMKPCRIFPKTSSRLSCRIIRPCLHFLFNPPAAGERNQARRTAPLNGRSRHLLPSRYPAVASGAVL